ncbi:MAG: flagellar motor protein MotB [Nitrosomonadaceae bacterium]
MAEGAEQKSAGPTQKPFVIKRVKKRHGGGHASGVWKIAYADFVTAMMAFFLLMWLLSSTDVGTLDGISSYFKTPLKVALSGGDRSGDSVNPIKGGGKDVVERDGQVKGGDSKKKKEAKKLEAQKDELKRAEAVQLKNLKEKIEEAIETNPSLKQYKEQLMVDITTEGLRIQIVDEQNRPMFALGRAELQSYTRTILREIGKTLNGVTNRVSLSGHTDARLYPTGDKGYSNWELSADRANASRRELIAGGMDESKILRVVGLSSAVMLDTENPLNPINRRISVIVMNKESEENVTKENERIVEIGIKEGTNKEKMRNATPKSQ